MRIKTNGNKSDAVMVVIKNAEASATIPVGAPVVMAFNATDDGIAVVLPSSASALKATSLVFGIATKTIAVGELCDAVVFGFAQVANILRQTRATTTDVWLIEAARSVGECLQINTVNNAFATVASTANIPPVAVLAQTIAGYASSASNVSDTRTAITTTAKVFARMM